MTGFAIVLAVLLAPIFVVLIWIGVRVNTLVRIAERTWGQPGGPK